MTEPDDASVPAEDATGEAETPEQERRRRFREALDRTQQGRHGHGAPAGPAQHAHTAPAVQRRVHRRKSG